MNQLVRPVEILALRVLIANTGPSCRAPISKERLFIREAFEPSDEELTGPPKVEAELVTSKSAESDEEMPDIKKFFGTPKPNKKSKAPEEKSKVKGKGKAKAKPERKLRPGRSQKKRCVVDSEDEGNADDVDVDEPESGDDNEDDDLSDFIVQSDEDEDEKDAYRASKRLMKHSATTSEGTEESDGEDIVIGRKRPAKDLPDPLANVHIKLLSRMLPSTKMLVRDFHGLPVEMLTTPPLAHDEAARDLGEGAS